MFVPFRAEHHQTPVDHQTDLPDSITGLGKYSTPSTLQLFILRSLITRPLLFG